MIKFSKYTTFFIFFSFINSACSPSFQGEYSDPTKAEIVDDKWNETDARLTAEVLISSMLKRPWLQDFQSINNGDKPFVVIGDIENRTDEHIDSRAMVEAVRFEMINSRQVRFVNEKAREKILNELNYQGESGMVSEHSAKKKGRQIGADFILTGAISAQVHFNGGLKTVTYQTMLNLTDLETSELVWTQKHDIKKRFNRSSSSW
jgi:uncharacterized protein (TIGR02722 family)